MRGLLHSHSDRISIAIVSHAINIQLLGMRGLRGVAECPLLVEVTEQSPEGQKKRPVEVELIPDRRT